jgi:hypothetical protein
MVEHPCPTRRGACLCLLLLLQLAQVAKARTAEESNQKYGAVSSVRHRDKNNTYSSDDDTTPNTPNNSVDDTTPSTLVLASGSPAIGETNARYVSWTVDSSYDRGFTHIDFDNANLLAGATSLAPSTLRFGGSGNDYLHYEPFVPSSCASRPDSDAYVCLNVSHWESLYAMARRSGTEFVFGVSYDMAQACADKEHYVWKAAPAVALIKYMQSKNQTIWGFELGNEVNNRMKTCSTTGGQQAAAFKVFQSQLKQLYPDASTRPKLLGPDVGYLNPEIFLGDFLGNCSSPSCDLHAVTYHVYSWLSKK